MPIPSRLLRLSKHRTQGPGAAAIALSIVCAGLGASLCGARPAAALERAPNFILIFCDDLGYGDIGCFGSTKHRTPHIDRLAREGTRMTSFYSTSGVCTPSRSSLMTGCYPRRVGMHVNARGEWVLFPIARKGLHPEETTIAETLRGRGYATAGIGKWHLGDQPRFLPTRQGFESWYGLPYSNDMGTGQRRPVKNPPLPLLRDETVIEAPADQTTLTRRYTEEAVRFIREHRERPFFLYMPHTFPHVPLFASEAFRGRSQNGKFGDAVEEIDWSVGEILATLDELGLAEDTVVVFTSDNGAQPRAGGSNAPLRGWKGSTLEGGMRVPCVVRWPGRVPAGAECDEVAAMIDWLPTFARLAGAALPEREIDGADIGPLLRGEPEARSPHARFLYYFTSRLQAVRSGRWKLHLAGETPGNRQRTPDAPSRLFDLDRDIGESTDLAAEHPEVVAALEALAAEARRELGDGDARGAGQREPGLVDEPQPLVMRAAGDE